MSEPSTESAERVDQGAATRRDEARKRVQHKRDFMMGLVAYVVVNGAFAAIWAVTGQGYFWPAWVMSLWAIGIVLDAWATWVRRPISEADVERELRRGR